MDSLSPLSVPALLFALGVALVVYTCVWWVYYERYEYEHEQDAMFDADWQCHEKAKEKRRPRPLADDGGSSGATV